MALLSTVRNVAAGRLPPATRFAVLCGCGVFVACLLVFRPVAGGAPAAKPLTSGVALLPPGNALAETQALLDPSAVYLPSSRGRGAVASGSEEVQLEDSPLAGFDPILRFSPGKPVDLTLESEKPIATPAYLAIPLTEWEPYATLGSANASQSWGVPRGLYYEIYPLSGANKPIFKDKLSTFLVKNEKNSPSNPNNAPLWSTLELIIGVDSMGLQSPATIVRSSGNKDVDAAVVSWSGQVPWAKRLPPGSYRLVVGP